ncbi:hypothetical protein SLEP1_g56576 [Rubroshorea leprosula]|uniref:Uncharacterized protein n=1 Tax=Rubroshorea leprosula TaxID=152421 RepID=A0AAV5MK33_9ROSI|nr:hypothetical protein SLEP1_g56576 [Rubroshorea leprosula]
MLEIALFLSHLFRCCFCRNHREHKLEISEIFVPFVRLSQKKYKRFSIVLSGGSGCLEVIGEDDEIGKMIWEDGDKKRSKLAKRRFFFFFLCGCPPRSGFERESDASIDPSGIVAATPPHSVPLHYCTHTPPRIPAAAPPLLSTVVQPLSFSSFRYKSRSKTSWHKVEEKLHIGEGGR